GEGPGSPKPAAPYRGAAASGDRPSDEGSGPDGAGRGSPGSSSCRPSVRRRGLGSGFGSRGRGGTASANPRGALVRARIWVFDPDRYWTPTPPSRFRTAPSA